MSYAHPSPPKIHWDFLTSKSLFASIASHAALTSPSHVQSLIASNNAAEETLDSSPKFIVASQFSIASFTVPVAFSAAAFTVSRRPSLRCFWPKYIPKPNSALSSNKELHQAGPCPFSFFV